MLIAVGALLLSNAPLSRVLAAPTEPPTATDIQAVEQAVEQKMRDAGIVGLGAAIIVGDRVVWRKGFGFADRETRTPFTPDTIAGVASITKTFVGVTMMQAEQQGRLSLDEDINRYLPFKVVNPHRPSDIITLRHLATHTSGIVDRPDVYVATYHFGGRKPEPLGTFLENYFVPGKAGYSAESFADVRPGAQREYSNIAASLAGYIVERATGKPLNQYARETIFKPLGMASTGWFLDDIDRRSYTTHYVLHNGMTVPIPAYSNTTYPDGGIRTSVNDLSRYFIALLNDGAGASGRILDPASVREMRRFQFNDSNRPENFPAADGNSGLFWRTKMNGALMGHGGNDPGIYAEMLTNAGGRIGVIVIANTSLSGKEQAISGAIFDDIWALARRYDGPTDDGAP